MSERERIQGPHQGQRVVMTGRPLDETEAVMILVHGRGGSAEGIINQIVRPLFDERMTYLAPQAAGHTWYPYSFLAPIPNNEPGISSGLQAIAELVEQVEAAGVPAEKIVFAGFSQGACLASEFVARNPRKYGGLMAFSGGVIGPLDMERNDSGDLAGTPIFLGCSDVDFHIPVERVHETEAIMTGMNATVNKKAVMDIRLGIHVGPAVAGVVGSKKFAFDIWGDTVNIASRMETNSIAGKINVSGEIYERCKEDFQFDYRGKVDVKNKGMYDMYFVERK